MSRSVRELTGSGGNEPHPIFNESLINQTTTYSKASVWILALMQAKAGVCVCVCGVGGDGVGGIQNNAVWTAQWFLPNTLKMMKLQGLKVEKKLQRNFDCGLVKQKH